jgi:hypothetical protein
MSLDVLRSIINTVVVPVTLLTAFACQNYSSKTHWVLWSVGLAANVAYTYLTADWFFVGYYLRFAFLGGYAFAIAYSSVSLPSLPLFLTIGSREAAGILLLVLFAPLAVIAARGRRSVGPGVHAVFPLRHGLYCVAQGGSNALLNHHFPARYARFALDIVKLNKMGFRARGFYPRELSKYMVFGETVFSPVEGMIAKVIDGVPDMVPPNQDREHPAGNHVIIKHASSGSLILLAHLQRNSLLVREGDAVSVGQPVGRVGNSGLSTEPHLHLSCEVDEVEEFNLEGVGIPILFDGKFLSRNTVVKSH